MDSDDDFDDSAISGDNVGSDNSEVGLSQKGINQIIKDTLPDARVREYVHKCCLSYIKYVTLEAQRLCNNSQRKTMTHEDIIQALRNLNFPYEHIESAGSVTDDCAEQKSRRLRRKQSRLEHCGVPTEELYRQQQQLIEQARLQTEEEDAQAMAEYREQMEADAARDQENGNNEADDEYD